MHQMVVGPREAAMVVGGLAVLARLKLDARVKMATRRNHQDTGILKVLKSGVQVKMTCDHGRDIITLVGDAKSVETEIAAALAALRTDPGHC